MSFRAFSLVARKACPVSSSLRRAGNQSRARRGLRACSSLLNSPAVAVRAAGAFSPLSGGAARSGTALDLSRSSPGLETQHHPNAATINTNAQRLGGLQGSVEGVAIRSLGNCATARDYSTAAFNPFRMKRQPLARRQGILMKGPALKNVTGSGLGCPVVSNRRHLQSRPGATASGQHQSAAPDGAMRSLWLVG